MRVRHHAAAALAFVAAALVIVAPPARAEMMPGDWIRQNFLTAKEITRLMDGPRFREILIRCDDEAVDGSPLYNPGPSNGCSSVVTVTITGDTPKAYVVAIALDTHATPEAAAGVLAREAGFKRVVINSPTEIASVRTQGGGFLSRATALSGTTTATGQCIGPTRKAAVTCARKVARAQLAKAAG